MRKASSDTLKKFVRQDSLNPPHLPEVRRYGTGEVAQILGMEMWRLQRFLSNPRFQLTASGQLGEGRGSRRFFTKQDVYRIGIAAFLARDGFALRLVSEVLQTVQDQDLIDFDENAARIDSGIALWRREGEPKIEVFSGAREVSVNGPYYVLNLAEITEEIDGRIRSLEKEQGK